MLSDRKNFYKKAKNLSISENILMQKMPTTTTKNCNFSQNWEIKLIAATLSQPTQKNSKNLEHFLGLSQIEFNLRKSPKVSVYKQLKKIIKNIL